MNGDTAHHPSRTIEHLGPVVKTIPFFVSAPQAAPVFRLDQPIVITIDGPAGTGKSSVARVLAQRLGLDFLDTGAMYRAAAAISIDMGIPLESADRLVDTVVRADLHFDWQADPPCILAFGSPMGARIRDADVTAIVSPVAAIASLRQHMVAKQRVIARQHPRLVTEGRDQGSVVFPDAKVKFYLDASPQVRAARRARQLRLAGQPADEGMLLDEITRRDASDMSRTDGPLRQPHDAVVVDTSCLEFDDVVAELEKIVRRKAGEPD
ncbi:MAG: (d)CMP kinase [Phycisphaeraceae bacterium]|nr:(d)CMP kinase [Phycisphaeraceae bacterium]